MAGIVAAALESHEAFLAVADENYLDQPTADAIEEYFGDLPEECTLEGEESAFSTEKARDLLGWEPKHHWRTTAEESVSVSLTAD